MAKAPSRNPCGFARLRRQRPSGRPRGWATAMLFCLRTPKMEHLPPMLKPHERQKDNLEHAHWRVDFLLCLLDSHCRLRFGQDPGWEEKEMDYLRRLAAAQADLDRWERLGESTKMRPPFHSQ